MTAQDPVFKHPTAYTWAAGVQREMPFGFVVDVTYVGRRGLQPAARAQHQPACGRARSRRTPASTSRRCGRTRATARSGCRRTRADRSTTACRSAPTAATATASSSASPTRSSKSEDNASNKRDVRVQHVRRHRPTGARRASIAGTCFSFYYIYDLPFWRDQTTLLKNLLGGWQISGATFIRTGTPFSVTRDRTTSPASATALRSAVQPGRRSERERQQRVLRRRRPTELLVQSGRVRRAGGRHVRQRAAQRHLRSRAVAVGHRAVQELRDQERPRVPVPGGDLQLPQPPEPEQPVNRIRPAATFGRITSKDNSRRDIQLSLRYVF